MKKIVILGCENTHATAFLEFIRDREEFSHLQVLGVYSEDPLAAQKTAERFSVPILEHYAQGVEEADGVMITARHGGLHYTYAKPYLHRRIPMFVDKPVTICPQEAMEFLRQLKAEGIPVTGGSSLGHDSLIRELKQHCIAETDGPTAGGFISAPLKSHNAYGDFFFYAPHLVEMVCQVFGRHPESVRVVADGGENRTVLFRYGNFFVTGLYVEGGKDYYARRFAQKGSQGGEISPENSKEWYYGEFRAFVDMLEGKPQPGSYEDLAMPVWITDAIQQAWESGREVPVPEVKL